MGSSIDLSSILAFKEAITGPKKDEKQEVTHQALVLDTLEDGMVWVKIDGSTVDATPVENLAVTAKAGDIVDVVIKDGVATAMANSRAQTVTTGYVNALMSALSGDTSALDGYLRTDEYDKFAAQDANFINLDSNTATIKELSADKAVVQSLNAVKARFEELEAQSATFRRLVVDAARSASDYITEIDGGGIMVHQRDDSSNAVRISSSVEIIKNDESVASYGEESRIGPSGGQHIIMGSGGLVAYDANGDLAYLNHVDVTALKEESQYIESLTNRAMRGISDIEKIVGTLNWIAEHGTYALTEDTVLVPSKTYYERQGEDPDYEYVPVQEPLEEELASYYELSLDESIQNYIAAHLYLANDGLHVVGSQSDYRATLSPDGLDISTPEGVSVATYGEAFRIGTTDKVHLLGTSTRLSFHTQAGDIAYFGLDDNDVWSMYIDNASVTDMIRFGNYAWVKRANGNMTIKYIEEAQGE